MLTDDIRPSRKKIIYPISNRFRNYLWHHGREVQLPVSYSDLMRMTYSVPLKDKSGKDTGWEKVIYDGREWDFIRTGLLETYSKLKTEGDLSFTRHLEVARVDYCSFGNSHPFRIRIVNKFNDNHDHYYIKQADASRAYGLELEHILSPNRILFYTYKSTLVEEHIAGIPGDVFIHTYMKEQGFNKIRFAKEFIKFNERCFIRLLGDMRAYNFVVEVTPDIEDFQYRIRAVDFDQQSYEGRMNLYRPQFFKDNLAFVELATKHLNQASIEQYQTEERTLIAYRIITSKRRLMDLINAMSNDILAPAEKIEELKSGLGEYFNTNYYLQCNTMGDIVKRHMKYTLTRNLKSLIESMKG